MRVGGNQWKRKDWAVQPFVEKSQVNSWQGGRGDSWKRVGLGYGLWGVKMGGERFFTSSLVQDIHQVENWHHQETLDETLYSTSSLPFIRFSTSHLQEVSTFNVINSLKAFNPSNVNCQIYVAGPVDVWQCGWVPQNPSGCIEIDRTAHVGWGGGAVRVYRQRHMTPLVSVPTYGGQSAFLCPLHIAVLYVLVVKYIW